MIGDVLFGRYRVDAPLSPSAQRDVWVWRGADLHALAPVVIKIGHRRVEPERALLEGEAMAAVRHPGVVRLIDFGLHEGRQPCLVMESVEGETLAQRLLSVDSLGWMTAFEIGARVLDGLAALHDEGLVHGDIVPENLVLPDGDPRRTKVVGLGHVAFTTTDAPTTVSDTSRLPALAYKAPEQLTGTALRFGSDIYALGVVLWEAICGVQPFARSPEDIALRIRFRPENAWVPSGPLPAAALAQLERMLQPSLIERESDARRCARGLRAALDAVAPARVCAPVTLAAV